MVRLKRKLFMEPSENNWEARAVLNPSVIKTKDGVEHMFYRGVAENLVSSIGYAKIIDGVIERFDEPVIFPTENYEKKGVEDPRVTKVGKIYYLLYTAFDGKDARIAYAVSKDLRKWKKKGIISPSISVGEAMKLVRIKKYRDKWEHQEIYGTRVCLWDKDAVLFPEKIGGKFVMLHRFLPDVQIVKFKNFSELKSDGFWKNYIVNLGDEEDKISLYRMHDWESEHIGAGAVPIRTEKGWLLIYHGVGLKDGNNSCDSSRKVYYTGAALLDLKKPETEVARLEKPLFFPKYRWERKGNIDNVVFPEGAIVDGDRLKIYYGCSDSRIGVAEMSLKKLMRKLR